jgi:hypothetical protein
MTIVRTVDPYFLESSNKEVVEESVGSGETGNPIYIRGKPASIGLHPDGTAKVQFTLSREALVAANTARWLDWSRGNVTEAVVDIPEGPITACRVVSISGDAIIEVVR